MLLPVMPIIPCMRSLIVSLHDVAPPFEKEIKAQIEALRAIGVERSVLKVVPNWHGSFPLSKTPSLVELLREQSELSSQLVLHGYEHRRKGPMRGSPVKLTRARLFAPNAAELMSLTGTEVLQSVRQGIEELHGSDLPIPDTFCAPAWLLTDEAEDALAEAGMKWLTGMFSLRSLRRGRIYWIPSYGFMGAGAGHEIGPSIIGRLESMAIRRLSRLKVYLHPDPTGRRRWMGAIGQIRDMIDSGWRPATFRDLTVQERLPLEA